MNNFYVILKNHPLTQLVENVDLQMLGMENGELCYKFSLSTY